MKTKGQRPSLSLQWHFSELSLDVVLKRLSVSYPREIQAVIKKGTGCEGKKASFGLCENDLRYAPSRGSLLQARDLFASNQ